MKVMFGLEGDGVIFGGYRKYLRGKTFMLSVKNPETKSTLLFQNAK